MRAVFILLVLALVGGDILIDDENDCGLIICENNGTLDEVDCLCICASGYTGLLCETEVSTSWPQGEYALPATLSGCPELDWIGGYVNLTIIDSQTDISRHYWSEVTNLLGPYHRRHVQLNFCSHVHRNRSDYTFSEAPTDNITGNGPWPPGSYCVYKYGDQCPDGFSAGNISLENYEAFPGRYGGAGLPIDTAMDVGGGGTGGGVGVSFCCRHDGDPSMEIDLPTSIAFFLFKERNASHCQYIRDADVTEELFSFLKQSEHTWHRHGEHPYIDEDSSIFNLTFCYYKTTARTECMYEVDTGASYMGTQNTSNGQSCLPWSYTPGLENKFKGNFESNYCRGMEWTYDRPVCYITGNTREECDIPICDDPEVTTLENVAYEALVYTSEGSPEGIWVTDSADVYLLDQQVMVDGYRPGIEIADDFLLNVLGVVDYDRRKRAKRLPKMFGRLDNLNYEFYMPFVEPWVTVELAYSHEISAIVLWRNTIRRRAGSPESHWERMYAWVGKQQWDFLTFGALACGSNMNMYVARVFRIQCERPLIGSYVTIQSNVRSDPDDPTDIYLRLMMVEIYVYGKRLSCGRKFGVQRADVLKSQITASSYEHGYHFNYARLNHKEIWCARIPDPAKYITVHLLVTMKVEAVIIQGQNSSSIQGYKMVESFRVKHGFRYETMQYYNDSDGPQTFYTAPIEEFGSTQTFYFGTPFLARIVGLEVEGEWPCLRMEWIVCKTLVERDCSNAPSVGWDLYPEHSGPPLPHEELVNMVMDTPEECRGACANMTSCMSYEYGSGVCRLSDRRTELPNSEPEELQTNKTTGERLCLKPIPIECNWDVHDETVIYNPNYPRGYDDNLVCTWNVYLASAVALQINFMDIDIYLIDSLMKKKDLRNTPYFYCQDYIEIKDHTNQRTERIMGRTYVNAKRARFITGGNNVTIRFRSCNNALRNTTFRGFKLRITKSDCPRCFERPYSTWHQCNFSCAYMHSNHFLSNLYTPSIHEYENLQFYIEGEFAPAFIRFEMLHVDVEQDDYNKLELYSNINQRRRQTINLKLENAIQVYYTHNEFIQFRARIRFKKGYRGFLAKYTLIEKEQLGRAQADTDSHLCEDKWVHYNGSCYNLKWKPRGASEVALKKFCRDMGAELATIKSIDVAEAMTLYCEEKQWKMVTLERVLIGLGRSDPRQPFKWSDGSIAIFHNWRQLWGYPTVGEPSYPELVKTCVSIDDLGYRLISNWDERGCGESLYLYGLCEKVIKQNGINPRTLPLIVMDAMGITPAKAVFVCLSGEMIELASMCDGKQQCIDGSDENNCTRNDGSCGGVSFQCLDGSACIDISRYCDFISDCPDGSDESTCYWPECGSQQFRCGNGACIDAERRCDLKVDCLDGLDESGCTKDTCRGSRGLYECGLRTGEAVCIPRQMVCDGYVDCPGTADERADDRCKIWRERATCADWYRDGYRDMNRVYTINTGDDTAVNVQCIFDEHNGTVYTIYRHRWEEAIPITDTEVLGYVNHYLDSEHSPGNFFKRSLMMINDYKMICRQTLEIQCYRFVANETTFRLRFSLAQHECNLYSDCTSEGRPLCDKPDSCKCASRKHAPQDQVFTDTFVIRLDEKGPIPQVLVNHIQPPSWATVKLGPVICSQTLPEKGDTILCNNGYVVPRSSQCLHYANSIGVHNGCRDKTHLLNCESFTCPYGFVKCPNSFCIALDKVCDGISDCEYEQDELNCGVWNCPNQYRCRDSVKCLSRYKVCDGTTDCPKGDDENICNEMCPDDCTCSPGYIDCSATNFRLDNMENVSSTVRSLNLHHTHLSFYEVSLSTNNQLFQNLVHLGELNISRCRIDFLYTEMFNGLGNLYLLDLSFNEFTSLPPNLFIPMLKLRNLQLMGNRLLSFIYPGAFSGLNLLSSLDMSEMSLTTLRADMWNGLSNITDLNISSNQISSIEGAAFTYVTNLRTLDISNNKIASFDGEAFTGLEKLISMFTDSFSFCCIRPTSVDINKCSPEPDKFSSCLNLLKNETIRVFLWLIGVFAVLGNVLTFVFRSFFETESLKNGYGILVTNLCFSDILMGIYILIISVADNIFRGKYSWNDMSWRSSSTCTLAGVLAITSAECSVLLLCLIALDRLKSIKFSLGTSPWISILACAGVWMVGLTMAIVPILPVPVLQAYFEDSFYSVNGVCMQLPLTSERLPGWAFSASIFILFNSVCFILLVGAQSVTYYTVTNTTIMLESVDRRNEFQVASRLGAIVFAKFITWCPICVLGLSALGGASIGAEVYMWMAVVVVPLNAALNPIIYMYSSFSNSKAGRMVLQWVGIRTETFPTETEVTKHLRSVRKLYDGQFILVGPEKHQQTLKDYFKQMASSDADDISADDIYRFTFQMATAVLVLHDLGLSIGHFNEDSVFVLLEYYYNKKVTQIVLKGLPRTVLDESDKYSNIASLGSVVSWMLKRFNVARMARKDRDL